MKRASESNAAIFKNIRITSRNNKKKRAAHVRDRRGRAEKDEANVMPSAESCCTPAGGKGGMVGDCSRQTGPMAGGNKSETAHDPCLLHASEQALNVLVMMSL